MNDFSVICRFCMKTDVSLQPLFETTFTENDKFANILPNELKELISFCLGLTVDEDDGFPKQFCVECFEKILSFSQFKERCIMAIETLTNRQQSREIKTTSITDVSSGIYEITDAESVRENDDNTANTSCDQPLYSKQCQFCGTMTRSLKQHMIIHTRQNLYKCPHCEKAFTQKGNLIRHIDIHSDVRRHKCELCPKRFNDQHSLKTHIITHTGKRIYPCGVCKKSFGHQYSLQQHIQIHTQNRQFECDMCGKLFLFKSGLKKHMRCHSNNRPYKCNICSKQFKAPSTLSTHLRIHSNTKHYKCIQCDEAYMYRNSFVRHLHTRHGLMAMPNVPITNNTLNFADCPIVKIKQAP